MNPDEKKNWNLFLPEVQISLPSPILVSIFQVPYESFKNSFLNNFAMTLGELNYKDTFIEGAAIPYPAAMNVLFIIFVLTMPIIMMNMLVRSTNNLPSLNSCYLAIEVLSKIQYKQQ